MLHQGEIILMRLQNLETNKNAKNRIESPWEQQRQTTCQSEELVVGGACESKWIPQELLCDIIDKLIERLNEVMNKTQFLISFIDKVHTYKEFACWCRKWNHNGWVQPKFI